MGSTTWGLTTETTRTAPGLGFTFHLLRQGDLSSFDQERAHHVGTVPCFNSDLLIPGSFPSPQASTCWEIQKFEKKKII